MRPILLAVTVLTILLLAVPPASPTGGHVDPAAPASSGPAPLAASPDSLPPSSSVPTAAAWGINTTLSPSLLSDPQVSPPAISDISPAPLPPIPATSPVVMTFLTNNKTCCVSSNFSAPTGTWALILLNYTGQAVAGVYDSSFRAYIDQAQVFFGTTPEYGIWYDEADMTPYSSLLVGTFNFTFLLGAAVTSGYFLTSVSLLFYPVPLGGDAPTEPNQVIPLWHRVFVSTTSTFVWDVATVPQNVTNATLQLWAYGFGPDEFWYAQQPGLRTLEVSADNASVVDFLPMEYINTGGNDLFAWRPITAAFTESDRPYDLDVTGLLSTLEGTHNLTAKLLGVTTGSSWLVGGSLLLYTRDNAPAAAAPVTSFAAGSPHVVSGTHSYAEFANDSFEAQSSFGAGATATTVTLFANTSYANVDLTPNGWENLTMVEHVWQSVVTDSNGTRVVADTNWTFLLSVDLASVFVPNAGQGTGYPIYGNVTEYMLNLRQVWNETGLTWSIGTSGPALLASYSVEYSVTGGNNLFIGTEELISANAAQLTSITFVESSTSAEYRATSVVGGLAWEFDHLVAGSGYNPPAPDQAETVSVNEIVSPIDAGLVTSRPEVDVGGSVILSARAVGGAGDYGFTWGGLPSGCTSNNSATLECQPTAPGTFLVWMVATDSSGTPSLMATTNLVVAPAPAIAIGGNGTVVDSNSLATFQAEVSGGVAPFTCTWRVPGAPIVTADCGTPLTTAAPGSGSVLDGVVSVTDGTGRLVNATFSFAGVDPPSLSLNGSLPTLAVAPTALLLEAEIAGGVAPYEFTWLVNSTVAQNSSSANFTLVIPAPGTYTVYVEVQDADGDQAVLGPFNVPASQSTSPSGGSPSPGSDTLEWALIAGIVAGAAGLIAGLLVGRVFWARLPPRSPRR